MAENNTSKPAVADRPGLAAPVVAGDGVLKVLAWLDVDRPRAAPRFHVVVRQRGGVEHDFFSMTPYRIKLLADQLNALHRQLAPPASAPVTTAGRKPVRRA